MSAIMLHDPGAMVEVTIDGAVMKLPSGMMLATALMTQNLRRLRHSPAARIPRGAFCFMGACQECVVLVDGMLVQACQTPARAGMTIILQRAP